ncbi:hypothetical protein [Streptomyces auratus]|uniref:Uncharacterized protein n=1 Tax=Streptomyces auratus AGR0001 TaxID=1160718 RepID=J1SBD9_9ACTN|nr:hypothetical protein [Streptomyces auratus]QTZ94643.1 hypothetical protein SU9_026985 [Streptomyces auratus AGR0001]
MPTLRAACAVVSPPRKPYDDDPSTLSYYRDLVEPFGLEVEEDLLRAGPNVGHRDLIDRLVTTGDIGDSTPDLVIVTQALPDITPFTAISPYLCRQLGGRATNFGIHQQGLAAPFTALRVISAFQRADRSREAVLAVLEQTTLPTRLPLVHDNHLVDSGVMLLFGQDGGPRVTGVETVSATEPVASRIGEVADMEPDGTLVVAGPWLDTAALADVRHQYQVSGGTYCTSVWLALARHWRSWHQEYTTVVLCDTDPRSGDSHLAVLRSDDHGTLPEPAGEGR